METIANKRYRERRKFATARDNIKCVVGFITKLKQDGKMSDEEWNNYLMKLHELDFKFYEEISK